MNDDLAFVETIRASPHDLLLRQVYADWLEERGDARGAMIRAWFQMHEAAREFRARLRAGFGDEADHQQFRRAVHDYQRLLKQVDAGWVRQLGGARPWINLDLATDLARLYLGGFGVARQPWRWIIKDGINGMDRAWLVPYRLPEAYEGFALSRNRSWMLIHKQYATVAQVGSAGPNPALANLEWNWLEA